MAIRTAIIIAVFVYVVTWECTLIIFFIYFLSMHTTDMCAFYNRFLLIVSRRKRRHRSRFSILIECHIDHIATGDLSDLSGNQIFSCYFNSNLHTRASNIMQLTVARNNIPDKSGSQKIKSLHPGRDYARTLAVLDGNDSCSLVNHTHNYPTMDISLYIRICQFHNTRGSTPRVGNTASLRQIYFRKSSVSIDYSLEWFHETFTITFNTPFSSARSTPLSPSSMVYP